MLQTVGQRFKRLFRKRRRSEGLRVGVALSDTEIAVALVRKLDGQRPKVLRIVVEEAPLGFADPVLKNIISEFDLRRIPVSAVIGASDYQIAQVQAPDVPRAEMRAAARYSMRDVFDFPIDDATLDAATLFLVAHFITDPFRVMTEILRVLKPGGKLVIVDLLAHERAEYAVQLGHVWQGFDGEQVKKWLSDAGFERCRYRALPADPSATGPTLFVASARRPTAVVGSSKENGAFMSATTSAPRGTGLLRASSET